MGLKVKVVKSLVRIKKNIRAVACGILFLISAAGVSFKTIPSSKTSAASLSKVEFSGFAQGTSWHLAYYASDTMVAKREIDSILSVIDSSLSIYKPYSRIVAFNNSRSGIKLDEHFRKVVEKSLDTYGKTGGLFDITVLPVVEAWGFGAKPFQKEPHATTVRSLLTCVSSKFLQLKNDELIKLKPCVRVDVNGIAQGYSVDVIAGFLEKKRIHDYIVELGGEIRFKGKKQPDNTLFKIGIEAPSPEDPDFAPLQKVIATDSGAITTSGNYRRYYESKGKNISHLIDPRTGYSVQNELISVTVYAKDAITADAYDNALMTMGLSAALKFVEQRDDLAAHFIYHHPDGSVTDTASRAFYRLIQN